MSDGSAVPQEIERKFLVANDAWRGHADAGREFLQAYLCGSDNAVVRVRIADQAKAFLTIKSAQAGLSRAEFEYAVPLDDAKKLMMLCSGSVLVKLRFLVPHAGRAWEVDVYSGENEGLVIAEVELESETAVVDPPPWLGSEVTGEARYYASHLAREPFCSWTDAPHAGNPPAGFGG